MEQEVGMLEVGVEAPDFTLTADDGSTVSLSDYRGKRVVVYFYPKANTSGCTRQACAIRDVYERVEAGDAVVIGISPDLPKALTKFRKDHQLPFVLLSDPDHAAAEAYGVWREKKMYGRTYMGIVRSHFAVDGKGRIADFKIKIKPVTTADLALHMVEL